MHHAGLLPIMKEVVEMLFCQGYIKVGSTVGEERGGEGARCGCAADSAWHVVGAHACMCAGAGVPARTGARKGGRAKGSAFCATAHCGRPCCAPASLA